MSRRLDDWITGWLDYRFNSEPPETYHLWTALSVLAAALERKVYLQWHTKIYANLYVVLVGPAGRTKKGTAMGPGLSMLRRLETLTIAAEATTKEALVNVLETAGNRSFQHPDHPQLIFTYSAMTIFSEELTVFLGYNNTDLMSWLCDWYDCRSDWTYRTVGRGEQDLSNVWVNLFGAITPALLQNAMPTDLLGGGLASRTIYVYEQDKRKTVAVPHKYNPETQMFDLKNYNELEEHLFHDLQKIRNMHGQFRFTKEFLAFWTDWYENTKPPTIEDPRMETYRTRRPTHLLKLSMLVNVSRTDDMLITDADAQHALDILELTEQKMHMTFAGMGKSDLAQVTHEIATIIGIKKEVRFSELLQQFYFDISAEQLGTIVATLMHIGLCTKKPIKQETKTGELKALDWWIIYSKEKV